MMTKRITTVLGDIAPEDLGFTTMHEHLLIPLLKTPFHDYMRESMASLPSEAFRLTHENAANLRAFKYLIAPDCEMLGDVDFAVGELELFKAAGGRSLCDGSPKGMRGPIGDYRLASERSGVNIICATGFYTAEGRPEEYRSNDEDFLLSVLRSELEEGIDGTDTRPGFLKCALNTLGDDGRIHPTELACGRVCAQLSAETGLSVHIHLGHPVAKEHVLTFVDMLTGEFGIAPDRILVLHTEQYLRSLTWVQEYIQDIETVRSIDISLQRELVERGVFIGIDTVASTILGLPDDYDRLKSLYWLINNGYAGQIVLGHDIIDKSHGAQWGWYGYTGFANTIIPQLRDYGVSNEDIDKITVGNPARILAY
jgi:phosphotriesterase-related protein